MPKINQIQNAISELEGGAFQKLMDDFLFKKGYSQINSIGSVIGSNKTRIGTPDTLIPLDNGKYVFVEYTTKENDIFNKFSDDIDKCLNKLKTGITTDKIEKIILCYTSQLSPEEIEKLSQKCQKVNVKLKSYDIHEIAFKLRHYYPSLVKDHLNIEVDTGQIIALDDFISLYEKARLATTLKTSFHFREFEKDRLLKSLLENNLVVISGQAGVGKTRLAIEGFRNFIAINSSYKAYCIFNRGVDFFEDTRCYFAEAGDYLIFVDDANRISGFQYLTQLFQTKRTDQNFKILVTVRDYALEKVQKICDNFEVADVIKLSSLENNEIKELIKAESNITDYVHLEKIVNISYGNPRMAMMATIVAKNNPTFEFTDTTELYDKYYSSIKNDLDNLKNENVLKVIGVISFFRSIDQSDTELMTLIKSLVNISTEDFREIARQLHKLELVDLFENDVVKISDQILATYILYLVFFKEKVLNFSVLLSRPFFPRFKQRLIETINPILNNFDFENSKKTMSSAVDSTYKSLQQDAPDTPFQLLDVFWFLKFTEILSLSKRIIDEMPTDNEQVDINELGTKTSYFELNSYLSLLNKSQYLGINEIRMSVELLLKYIEKQPKQLFHIANLLANDYSFKYNNGKPNYVVQQTVIDEVIKYCNSGKNDCFFRLFIVLAEKYLNTYCNIVKPTRDDAVNFLTIILPKTKKLIELRTTIWSHLFFFYKNEELQKDISLLLFRYSQSRIETTANNIIEEDQNSVLTFFQKNFSPSNLWHCVVVQNYLNFLKELNISHSNFEGLSQFNSNDYKYYEVIKREEYKSNRITQKKKITTFFQAFTIEDYKRFLKAFSDTALYQAGERYPYKIKQGFSIVLEELYERNFSLYICVLKELSQTDWGILNIDANSSVNQLVSSDCAMTTFEVIQTIKSPQKDNWLACYYIHLPQKDIKPNDLNNLITLYTTAEYKYLTVFSDYLLKYESIEKGFIIRITEAVSKKLEVEPIAGLLLSLLFNEHTEINKTLIPLFVDHIEFIEDIYIKVDMIDQNMDYGGITFSKFIDNDKFFIDKYLKNQLTTNSFSRNNRDYSFIWKRNDYIDVMKEITINLFEHYQQGKHLSYTSVQCYKYFFTLKQDANSQTSKEIIDYQKKFLEEEIRSGINNDDYMNFLFSVIPTFDSKHQLLFYQQVLQLNCNARLFEALLTPLFLTKSWSGSEVPLLQEEKSFYESLLPSCNSIALLEHKQFIENKIEKINKDIQIEKKRDFTEDY
ncbi:hypothetical protein [Beggiatoa leptomitoformis]|uniref:Uncharacterized protein n=1 Tax=Beggiatoa leptomitoformis TaxID=288004 RepID=A0A2N9YAG7_9GAMM|nr:hypothetical protein [Beggiatoa leptomitoformis]ALG67145.1 hypothetical protein AL038_04740 [Beggiatoa leptomitoformis]AUI67455.1 hypothetical protein BLE401_01260 [Beggiatoa leptomitoformis]